MLWNYITAIYTELKPKEMDDVKYELVILATDLCISFSAESYGTITCHFMDSDWNMKCVLIATRSIVVPHSGENMKEVLLTIAGNLSSLPWWVWWPIMQATWYLVCQVTNLDCIWDVSHTFCSCASTPPSKYHKFPRQFPQSDTWLAISTTACIRQEHLKNHKSHSLG